MKHRSLYDRMIPVIFACILVSMATGSFWDLSISYALLNQESLPALLAAGYGSMPNYLLGVICGYLLIRRASPAVLRTSGLRRAGSGRLRLLRGL